VGTSLNWVDLVIAVIVAGNALLGIRRGILREAFNLAGIGVGLFAGLRLYEELGWNVEGWSGASPETANLAAFVAVFLACAVGAEYVGYLLHKGARRLFMGWLDRLAGGVFGCVRGLILASVAALALALFPFTPKIEQDLRSSVLGPHVVKVAPAVYGSAMKKARGAGYEGMDIEKLVDEYINDGRPDAASTAETAGPPSGAAKTGASGGKKAGSGKASDGLLGSD
jgi:membrane protein required for colicin V production